MNFLDLTKQRFEKLNTVLCMGLDPILEKIPLKGKNDIEKVLVDFYFSLLENFHSYCIAVKPNIAFYEQYGIDGIRALKKIIDKARTLEIPVILDVKRNDIGDTAKAYVKACFMELKADAVTLSPYLGEDSLAPFFEYKDKGFFVLVRTSNKGSSDFQMIKSENGKFLFEIVADKVCEWNKKYSSGIGAVLGATHLEELKKIARLFSVNDYPPLLIPGIGKQGGDLKEVMSALKEIDYPLHKVFINSSTKINYAYLDFPDKNYLEAALVEIKKFDLKNI
jgi:orotidine-5'-phosphate decarboxylase